jgi:hypothetical protein
MSPKQGPKSHHKIHDANGPVSDEDMIKELNELKTTIWIRDSIIHHMGGVLLALKGKLDNGGKFDEGDRKALNGLHSYYKPFFPWVSHPGRPGPASQPPARRKTPPRVFTGDDDDDDDDERPGSTTPRATNPFKPPKT